MVEDEGVGIAEEERDRVFEEFFRSADPRVRERAGTGLGLAIVERAVSRHGGRVDVESAPDEGTRFRVLPPAGRLSRLDGVLDGWRVRLG